MTIVTSYDFESDTWTHHNGELPARHAWREAVAEIAAKAKAKLPECNGRVESAVKIVLAGDVELLADGTARVASQSNGTTKYFVDNGECSCPDFAKAPSNWCKHRIAAGLAKRVAQRVKAQWDSQAATSSQLLRLSRLCLKRQRVSTSTSSWLAARCN
jgi:predicted nucleic acid-binding Zn finger protein